MNTHNGAHAGGKDIAARPPVDSSSLWTELGLSRRAIASRKAFLEIAEQDEQRLATFAPQTKKYADEVIEKLYDHLLAFPESREFLQNRATRERVKRQQKQYFLRMTSGRYDERYVKNRLLIGATHERIGLPVETYLGAYCRYLYLIRRRLLGAGRGPMRVKLDLLNSLLKVMFFDVGLAIDTYVARREQTIRRQHEELRRRYQELEEAGRVKNDFLANMSHELRTPLNAIIGFAQLLHDGRLGAVHEAHKPYLADLLANARHLFELINGMLDMARIESGAMSFRPEPIDVALLMREARQSFAPLAAQRQIRLRTETHCRGAPVLDRDRLKQVLFNYLSNAVKFTGPGGKVVARIRHQDHQLVIEVEDTGIGIRRRDLPRLFVHFQQLDGGRSKKFQGTGLGLAITKRLVEAQGGSVGVSSTPGVGSRFYARIPLIQPMPVKIPAAEQARPM